MTVITGSPVRADDEAMGPARARIEAEIERLLLHAPWPIDDVRAVPGAGVAQARGSLVGPAARLRCVTSSRTRGPLARRHATQVT